MNRLFSFGIAMLLAGVSTVEAQPPLQLAIGANKTTSLVFPYAIRHVDRGSDQVAVQQVAAAENLLLIKAASPELTPTNLSVVTADGQVYSFSIVYVDMPMHTVIDVPRLSKADHRPISFSDEVMNRYDIESYSKGIIDNRPFLRGISNYSWGIQCRITGIYVQGNVMFYQLAFQNSSSIDYDMEYLRFFVKDRKKGKRTASQELVKEPLYKVGYTDKVQAGSKRIMVFALERFTIPDAKNFILQIGERNGGRHLRLRITNKKLLHAKQLPAY